MAGFLCVVKARLRLQLTQKLESSNVVSLLLHKYLYRLANKI